MNLRITRLLLLSLLLASAFAGCGRAPSIPKQGVDVGSVVAQRLGELAGTLLPKSARVLVVHCEPAADLAEGERRQDAALRAALEHAGLAVAGELVLPVKVGPMSGKPGDTNGPIIAVAPPGLPPQWLADQVARAPKADAVVSLAGDPLLGAADIARWKGKLPPLVTLSVSGQDTQALVDGGLVLGAIRPRQAPPPAGVNRDDFFVVGYEYVRPASGR